ncbi:HupE/UreJ family protein [Tropicibacter sp. Alg240-R139]|uniref:HupE/UreJ family protein n=1 Tax=Tropicibacter sp. Alg240-R139 TaxID=2305991 RepID=UPI001F08314F|nr:HupE/UreJ family protein [Tropicibacter sp. Alg240-R139]
MGPTMALRSICLAILLTIAALISGHSTASAHSLGVDRADLVETTPGTYRLTSKVPRRISSAILTPDLPDRCTIIGNPNGERGGYAVVFVFTCSTRLSADDTLFLPWKREGTLLTVKWLEQEPVTRLAKRTGDVIEVELNEWLAGSGSTLRAAQRYTVLGIEHILAGVDHLLFVLALIFVVNSRWKLVKAITAFTVAHSITLGLATLGYVNLPSAPVEAAIALSIVFLASEIVWKSRGRTSLTFEAPWIVAFAFGLLHGLGFAGALSEIGLPPAEIPIALLFFNFGVEVGQLIFVALVLTLGWLFAHLGLSEGKRSAARLIIIYGIGMVAMYWTVERVAAVVA